MPLFNSKKVSTENLHIYFLVLLIITEILFIILHLITNHGPKYAGIQVTEQFQILAWQLRVDTDWGYPEMFQYIQTFWTVLLLGALWFKIKQPIYIIWTFLFSFLLVEDFFQIHETIGDSQIETFQMFGELARDIGEIIWFLVVGSIFFVVIVIVYKFSSEQAKKVTRNLFVLVMMLIFFGFFWDIIHSAFKHLRFAHTILAIIEDGGEMIVMSIICWYSLNLFKHRDNVDSLDFVSGLTAKYLRKNK